MAENRANCTSIQRSILAFKQHGDGGSLCKVVVASGPDASAALKSTIT